MTSTTDMRALAERLRKLSPELDMLACEDVLKAADALSSLVSERDELARQLAQMRNERDGERDAREKASEALRQKDQAMGMLCELADTDIIERAQIILERRHASRQPAAEKEES